MTLTTGQARNAVMSLIDAALAADPLTAGVLRLYGNVKGDKPGEDGTTEKAAPFFRLNTLVVASTQSTQGAKRYLTTGDVTVQVFTPFGDGYTLSDSYSQVVLGILRGHVGSAGGVWFFDAVAQEIGEDGPWFQTNVTASFRYQEVP